MIEVYSPSIKRKEMAAVLQALVDEKIGPGEQGERLIEIAKEPLKFEYCEALRSPVFALSRALKALQLEAGSGIAISAFSPVYYLTVIEELGLKPVIFDCLGASPFPSLDSINAAIERAKEQSPVRCIVLYHSLGLLPKIDDIMTIGLPVIEDCSTAFASTFGGIPAGCFGTFTILGLEERDMLTAGGGALLYATEKRNASVLRNAPHLPAEYALPDMNAAMAIVQFREFTKNSLRQKEYAELFTHAAMQGRHKLFVTCDNFVYNNYAFALVLETGMKDVVAWAKRKEIVVENAFSNTIMNLGNIPQNLCPNADSLSLRTALFPIYPRLGSANAVKIGKLIENLP